MRKLSHLKLGLFLLFCVAAGAVAVIWVGATHAFERSKTYAAFFADPVTGLQSGAPVRHLGIQIGRVDSVDLAPGGRVVRVVLKLTPQFQVGPDLALSVTQAGITGSPFLALEETPAEERKEPPHPPTADPVLPTRSAGGGIAGIERKIASLDLEGLLRRWEGVAARLERAADLGATAMRDVHENVGTSAELLRQDLAQLRQAAVEAQSLARSLRNQPGRVLEEGTGNDPFRR